MSVPPDVVELREARRSAVESDFRLSAASDDLHRRSVRDAAVTEFLDVADAVARRFTRRAQDADDLRQVAYLGLIKAAARFDPEKGSDFVSFAVPTISGELKRHLRDHGWMIRPPRQIQELRALVIAAAPRLAQLLGHLPSDRELADHLGEPVANIADAYLSQDGLTPVSLDLAITADEGLTLGEALGAVDPGMEQVERVSDLRRAVALLTPRERRIVHLRFFEDRTQQQIAGELGVTQMQVSRLLAKILDRLRVALGAPRPALGERPTQSAPPTVDLLTA